jgi:3-phosphoshikimate 1-carboxyvinyltransferase
LRGDVSSQFLTALLMALPLTGHRAVIEMTTELISKPYIEITLKLMARFGVQVEREGWQRFSISAGSKLSQPGHPLCGRRRVLGLVFPRGRRHRWRTGARRRDRQGFHPGRRALRRRVGKTRRTITWGDNWIEAAAPRGKLKAFDLDLNHIPDAAMTLAVAALFADGPCRLRNIASWRVKETDRIAAMATELRKLGATVEEGADYLAVSPAPTFIAAAVIDTYDDHRMAMCFSLAALAGVTVSINDPQCVNKTFPGYFDAFAEITAPVIAIDGPSASGKGTVAERVADATGLSLPRQRVALSPDRPGGAAGRRRAG